MSKRSKLRRDAPRVLPVEIKPTRKHLTLTEWKAVREVLEDRYFDAVAGAPPSKELRTLRDRALILAMYATGARRDEPGTWTLDYLRELHKGRMYIFRGKGSTAGFCEVPEYVVTVLGAWLEERYPDVSERQREWWVFPGVRRKGQEAQGISDRNVYRIFNDVAKAAGLPKHLRHPHTLKRSRGQHMLELGVAEGRSAEDMIPIIARALGHKNQAVTRKHYLAETQADKDLVRRVSEQVVPSGALEEQQDAEGVEEE